MKQISFLLLFSFLWIQSSAGQELPDYSPEDASIVANIDSIRSVELKLSNFSNVRYIPLETTDDCLIGNINKALIRNNRIYVADFDQAFALFVFDLQGKFLFKIARMGQGPGEYVSFRDFDIQSNGDIYMFDHFGRKFLLFDSEGEYLRDMGTDYTLSSFCLVKNKMYWSKLLVPGKRLAELAVYDMTAKRTDFLLKNSKWLSHNVHINYASYVFYNSPSGATYYSPRFSNIIYSIGENGVKPAIGIKNLRMPPEDIIKKWEEDSKNAKFTIVDDKLYFKENIHIYETDMKVVGGL
jgi:hypothetical protein